MRYAFAIDHRKCIGCHACTVACKTEHGVPLGNFRTWVKYVERGEFPSVRRYFTVLRCNHCAHAPCVTICPTSALFTRRDGVVDFNKDRCIGCKSCMQACPYDALYIDPDTNTAAKCNFCAHRLEVGLEPACVIVCPEQAIIAGDLDNASSQIARLVHREPAEVRKPEQGTGPNVYYIGADAASLSPTAIARGETYLWAQARAADGGGGLGAASAPAATPGQAEARGPLGQVTYDVPHPAPWGWKVSTYLWTKSIAAGSLLAAPFAGPPDTFHTKLFPWLSSLAAPLLALVFLMLTAGLLTFDLRKPERFHYILLRPNWTSWLVRGTWILMAFGGASIVWFFAGRADDHSLLHALILPCMVLAAATAGYSAILFGQCEGRDFWQTSLVFWQLLISAVAAGAASLLLIGLLSSSSLDEVRWAGETLSIALLAKLALILFEYLGPHGNQEAVRAARLLTHGQFKTYFWIGVVLGGLLLPKFLLSLWATRLGVAVAAGLALAGLWLYEDLWVRAGQTVPLS